MVFRQRLVNPNQDNSIKCECRGIKITENCMDLPTYASCGYLRFRMPMFRETTYNTLTDNQKKDFHNRAVRYLEKETRRCRSCGNGFFVRILGARNDDVSIHASGSYHIEDISTITTDFYGSLSFSLVEISNCHVRLQPLCD